MNSQNLQNMHTVNGNTRDKLPHSFSSQHFTQTPQSLNQSPQYSSFPSRTIVHGTSMPNGSMPNGNTHQYPRNMISLTNIQPNMQNMQGMQNMSSIPRQNMQNVQNMHGLQGFQNMQGNMTQGNMQSMQGMQSLQSMQNLQGLQGFTTIPHHTTLPHSSMSTNSIQNPLQPNPLQSNSWHQNTLQGSLAQGSLHHGTMHNTIGSLPNHLTCDTLNLQSTMHGLQNPMQSSISTPIPSPMPSSIQNSLSTALPMSLQNSLSNPMQGNLSNSISNGFTNSHHPNNLANSLSNNLSNNLSSNLQNSLSNNISNNLTSNIPNSLPNTFQNNISLSNTISGNMQGTLQSNVQNVQSLDNRSGRNTSGQQQYPFHSRFQCIRKIGSGSFGTVYLALDLLHNENVAVKFEQKNTNFPQLLREARHLKYLTENCPQDETIGIPRIIFIGETNNHRCLVQELLGDSLEAIFQSRNRKFSLKTILLLADQIISRLEFVHNKGYLHRDVKPENFLMGRPDSQYSLCLYIIDFGLSKRYLSENGEHIQFKVNKSLTGTARYASISNHLGYEQSRRDDMEAVGYMLVYFLREGKLPWSGLPGGNKEEKYRNILNKKKNTPLHELLDSFPDAFRRYLEYVQDLSFDQKPEYNNLRALFRNVYTQYRFSMDYVFDWTT